MSLTSIGKERRSAVRRRSGGIRPLVLSLVGIGISAILFTLLIIQLQSGVAGYLAGESIWSRGEVETIRMMARYARTGDTGELAAARAWHQVPLGDLHARLAMERGDYEAAFDGFLRGRNHPDDIPRMIWLFRLLHDAPYFHEAIAAWRATDDDIRALDAIMDDLERAWQSGQGGAADIAALQARLERANENLSEQAGRFRDSMTQASRALVNILSVATVVFFAVLGLISALLIMRFTRVIRKSEYKFRKTFEHAALGIVQVDDEGRVLEANEAICRILGYTREHLLSIRYQSLIHDDDKALQRQERFELAKGLRDHLVVEQRLHKGDGKVMWARITMSRIEEVPHRGMVFVGLVEDVSASHLLSEELNYQARHDDLTGLINRRAFEEYLDEAIAKARHEHFMHDLCFIDLDQFKIVNDTLGHPVGDQLLKQVAQVLEQQLRKGDLLARLGGDEFALILECCEPEAAVKLAEELLSALEAAPFSWDDRSFHVGCSIGIVPITPTSGDSADLMRIADAACYYAKEQGRNRVWLSHEDDAALLERREQMEWLARIRQALEENRFFLDAQRIESLELNPDMRYEVLIRLRDENGATVPPGAFLPAAERFGMAHLLDRWVIEEVCKVLSSHSDHLEHLDACHINISGKSFDHEDFSEYVTELLSQYDIPAEKICFEITETAAISRMTEVRRFMAVLRHEGATFALDDFGSGLSSFSYLKQMPIDILKIDGAFVRNMSQDETDRAMVRAIADIGQTLGKQVVAEFVEDARAVGYLQDMGVHFAQGFHLHRPEPVAKLLQQNLNIATHSVRMDTDAEVDDKH